MKQTCDYMERLHLLKDGELSAVEQGRILKHLQECDACRAEWETLTQVAQMLDTIDDVTPSPGFDETFWDKVDAFERNRPARMLDWLFSNPLRRVMVPVTAVLVLGAGLYLGMNTMTPYSDEMTLSDQIDLLEDFDVVNNLDLLENWDAINRMKVKT